MKKTVTKKTLIEIHKQLIYFLKSVSPKQRVKFVKLLNKQQINALSEIFENILKYYLTDDKKL